MNKRNFVLFSLFAFILVLASCQKDPGTTPGPGSTPDPGTTPLPIGKDPNTAELASIDRFSATAGHLQVRKAGNGLPAANAAINFDQDPFITKGFTPSGQTVEYYNFDLQPTTPAPIWVLYKNGQTSPVAGQLNIIEVIPGDAGYNDFWQVYKVIVPDNYVPNTVTSYSEIIAKGYSVTSTTNIVNCPIVPNGSTATKRFGTNEDPGLTKGWYKGKLVFYFNFFEKALTTISNGLVPVSPIYVTFNINPNQPTGGPASGFKMELGNQQTHNVISTLPTDAGYSPLWTIKVYDNASFATVLNLTTAVAASLIVTDARNVNCPVVKIQ